MRYYCVVVDDIPTIFHGRVDQDPRKIGRALTLKDGNLLTEELNRSGAAELRDRLLTAVTDAIEEEFEPK